MHDSRVNTFAAIGIVVLFGIGAVLIIERAIMHIDWTYTSLDDMAIVGSK